MSWQRLGAVAPTELVEARLMLHHAAQIVASAGVSFLAPQPDDSHPNFGWLEDLGALMDRRLPGTDAQVGLRLADVTLLLADANARVDDELALAGKTLEDGYAGLAASTGRARERLPPMRINRAAYTIPSHAVAGGATFSIASPDACAELARWFSNAQHALSELAAETPGTSDVRCWPHHFDLAALIVVATQPDGSLAKSIGIGLSPGDDDYAEPYGYVSPWPYPEPSALPVLETGGHWHTQTTTSAVLTGSDLVGGPPASQADRLNDFLTAAIDASRRALVD